MGGAALYRRCRIKKFAKFSTSERATECTLAYGHHYVRWRVGIVGEEDAIISACAASEPAWRAEHRIQCKGMSEQRERDRDRQNDESWYREAA